MVVAQKLPLAQVDTGKESPLWFTIREIDTHHKVSSVLMVDRAG